MMNHLDCEQVLVILLPSRTAVTMDRVEPIRVEMNVRAVLLMEKSAHNGPGAIGYWDDAIFGKVALGAGESVHLTREF